MKFHSNVLQPVSGHGERASTAAVHAADNDLGSFIPSAKAKPVTAAKGDKQTERRYSGIFS